MKIVKTEKCLCTCCMEEHEVKTVLDEENVTFKGKKISYMATYLYCDFAEELYVNETLMRKNDRHMKDAYRRSEGLLTSDDIRQIREKYVISQKDLCIVLGWGAKTITRYESYQVQDRAHDAVLKKMDQDPEWFLLLLCESKNGLPIENYEKYRNRASELYEENQDMYLRKTIEANYARYHQEPTFHGNTGLSLDKTVDVIRYFASSKEVTSLYKVKLMKLMWYADALSYKIRGKAITGLIYRSLPMGAVPIGHDGIIHLKQVPCEEIDMGETNAYYFSLKNVSAFPNLSEAEKEILNKVIEKLGEMTKTQIVSFMHEEEAYINTAPREIISFKYAKALKI